MYLLALHRRSIYCFTYLPRLTSWKCHKTGIFIIFCTLNKGWHSGTPNKYLLNEMVVDRSSEEIQLLVKETLGLRFWILKKTQSQLSMDWHSILTQGSSNLERTGCNTEPRDKNTENSLREHLHISLNIIWLMISQISWWKKAKKLSNKI